MLLASFNHAEYVNYSDVVIELVIDFGQRATLSDSSDMVWYAHRLFQKIYDMLRYC